MRGIRVSRRQSESRRQARVAPAVDDLVALIWNTAVDIARGQDVSAAMVASLAGRLGGHGRQADTAADMALRQAVAQLWGNGWQPNDVYQIAVRRLDETTVPLVVDVIAAELEQRSAAAVHPRWREQLEQLDASVWWQPDAPLLSQWAQRHGCTRAEALSAVIAVLSVLVALPVLPEIPLPSTPAAGVDEKMLARVRALLAKAESTQFPEEAEALSAKAQELMSRYSFERALVEPGERRQGSARRFWLENPYLAAKSSLISAVASANRCRAVSYEKLGFVALVGHEVDLDIVELLATSLLVQATEAMLAAGRQISRTGQSRTRSFRQSFLIAYATRIRERLTEADRVTSEQVADERLLPV